MARPREERSYMDMKAENAAPSPGKKKELEPEQSADPTLDETNEHDLDNRSNTSENHYRHQGLRADSAAIPNPQASTQMGITSNPSMVGQNGPNMQPQQQQLLDLTP